MKLFQLTEAELHFVYHHKDDGTVKLSLDLFRKNIETWLWKDTSITSDHDTSR